MLEENCEGEICNYSSKHEFRFLGLWLSEFEECSAEVSNFSRFWKQPEIKVAKGKDSLVEGSRFHGLAERQQGQLKCEEKSLKIETQHR